MASTVQHTHTNIGKGCLKIIASHLLTPQHTVCFRLNHTHWGFFSCPRFLNITASKGTQKPWCCRFPFPDVCPSLNWRNNSPTTGETTETTWRKLYWVSRAVPSHLYRFRVELAFRGFVWNKSRLEWISIYCLFAVSPLPNDTLLRVKPSSTLSFDRVLRRLFVHFIK